MTNQEAIKSLKNIVEYWTYKPTEVQAAQLAISALEREEAIRPREHYNWCDFSDDEKLENSHWFCKNCGWSVEENWVYCPGCGQKNKWD